MCLAILDGQGRISMTVKRTVANCLKKLGMEETVRDIFYGLTGRWLPKKVMLHGIPAKFFVTTSHAADTVHLLPEESEAQEWFVKHIRPGDVVWDIGANVGQWAVYCARALSQGGRLYCFEPGPQVSRLLRRTLAVNHLELAYVLPYALSDRDGEAQLFLGVGDSSLSSLERRTDGFPVQDTGISIQTMSAASVVAQGLSSAPHLIKLDAEGSEWSILKGFSEAIWAACHTLLVEVHPLLLKTMGGSMEEIRQLLKEKGFFIEQAIPRSTIQLWLCRKQM